MKPRICDGWGWKAVRCCECKHGQEQEQRCRHERASKCESRNMRQGEQRIIAHEQERARVAHPGRRAQRPRDNTTGQSLVLTAVATHSSYLNRKPCPFERRKHSSAKRKLASIKTIREGLLRLCCALTFGLAWTLRKTNGHGGLKNLRVLQHGG